MQAFQLSIYNSFNICKWESISNSLFWNAFRWKKKAWFPYLNNSMGDWSILLFCQVSNLKKILSRITQLMMTECQLVFIGSVVQYFVLIVKGMTHFSLSITEDFFSMQADHAGIWVCFVLLGFFYCKIRFYFPMFYCNKEAMPQKNYCYFACWKYTHTLKLWVLVVQQWTKCG